MEKVEQKTFKNTEEALDDLVLHLQPSLLGTNIVISWIEVQNQILRVVIEKENSSEGITADDCAKVSHLIDPFLDTHPWVDAHFRGSYELEVSSPGIFRALRKDSDYIRFSGRRVKINVFRPLTAEELHEKEYQNRFPKQKTFIGTLNSLEGEDLILSDLEDGSETKKKKKKNDFSLSGLKIHIPKNLISKANLEPKFEVGHKK